MRVLDGAAEIVESTTITKSWFVATLAPVSSERELTALVDRLRDPSASHTCWGAVIGNGPHQITRCSDDGEPGGTAGPPILAALVSRDVVNAAVVVVRWFGGVKLGAGGLVRAYGGAAGAVLDSAPLREARSISVVRVAIPAGDAGRVEQVLYSAGEVRDVEYGAQHVEYSVHVAAAEESGLRDRVLSLTSGAAEILGVEHRFA